MTQRTITSAFVVLLGLAVSVEGTKSGHEAAGCSMPDGCPKHSMSENMVMLQVQGQKQLPKDPRSTGTPKDLCRADCDKYYDWATDTLNEERMKQEASAYFTCFSTCVPRQASISVQHRCYSQCDDDDWEERDWGTLRDATDKFSDCYSDCYNKPEQDATQEVQNLPIEKEPSTGSSVKDQCRDDCSKWYDWSTSALDGERLERQAFAYFTCFKACNHHDGVPVSSEPNEKGCFAKCAYKDDWEELDREGQKEAVDNWHDCFVECRKG